MAEHNSANNLKENELNVELGLVEVVQNLKRRILHLETLESVPTPFVNLGTGSTLIIAGGTITVTESSHRVDTQGAAGTDNLDTVNGGEAEDLLVLRALNSSRNIVLRDNVGNLNLAGNFTLNHIRDTITLINRGGIAWIEISRSDNE